MALVLFSASIALLCYILYTIRRLLLRYFHRRHLTKSNNCLPPRKIYQKDPILGIDIVQENLAAAKEFGFLKLLQRRHNNNGLTFTTDTFFRTTINTCDPRVIQSVLSLQFDDFGMGPLRRKSASPLLGRGIFTSDDEAWSHQRALIRPSFVRAQVTEFSVFERHVDQLIRLMSRQNYIVDLQALFFRSVLDTNSEYMLGESVGLLKEQASESAQEFQNALDYAQQGTILRLRLGNAMFIHRDPKHWRSCDVVHRYADRFVARALEHRRREKSSLGIDNESGEKQPYVFLNELAKDTEDPIVLRDQIVNILLAARDTTAGLLAFVFFVLARRPDVWAKLRADILEHYCEPLTYDAVMEMTYLRYVLQETIRLFPPISTNSRMANKDTWIPVGGGPDGNSPLFVAKHNVVQYSTFVMHRRPEFFGPDAEEFRPERWEKLRPGWEYLPFNGGPRICPGQKFALTEASYTTARLLHAFESIENRDPGDWKEQLTLSLTLNNGVQVKLNPAPCC